MRARVSGWNEGSVTRRVVGLFCALLFFMLQPTSSAADGTGKAEPTTKPASTLEVAPPVQDRRMCIYDPVGEVGDMHALSKDLQADALGWGVRLELVVNQSEQIVVSEFISRQCDLVFITGVRARDFVRFTGTIEAMGAIPSYDHLADVVNLLSQPKAAKMMRDDQYESLGVFAVGGVFLFLRNRDFNSVRDLAGKRFATLAHDEAGKYLVRRIGGSIIPADVSTFSGMFINGGVDACYSTAATYAPLELGKGLSHGGGIPVMPVTHLTMQIIARTDAGLPKGFAAKLRKWAAAHFDHTADLAKAAEASIPKKLWIPVSAKQQASYDALFLDTRIHLRKDGVYHPTMLRLMRRVRCKRDPSRAECAEKRE